MKFHKQLIVDPGRGDCTRTCVACMLDLDVLDVPNFIEMGDNPSEMWTHMRVWLNSRGLAPLELMAETSPNHTWFKGIHDMIALTGALCLGSIPSQRYDGGWHSVVCQVKSLVNDDNSRSWVDIIHDPSPCNPPYPWFAQLARVTFFVPVVAPIASARQQYGPRVGHYPYVTLPA